jgi:hypothetical protein
MSGDLSGSSAQFERLADKWGNDSRYWQLRLQYDPAIWQNDAATDKRILARKAAELAPQDGRVLLHQYLVESYVNSTDASSELAHVIDQNTSDADTARFIRQQREWVIAQGRDETGLLERLAAAMPQDALPHYLLAMIAAERQDYAAAREELQLGSQKPECSFPDIYPRSEISAAIEAGEFHRDQLLGEMLSNRTQTRYVRDWERHETQLMVRLLMGEAIRRDDRAMMTQLHELCYRRAIAAPGIAECSQWMRIGSKLPDQFQVAASQETLAASAPGLGELQLQTGNLIGSASQFRTRMQNAQPAGFEGWLAGRLDPWLDGRPGRLRSAKVEYTSLKESRAELESLRRKLDRLAQFDFASMSWPGLRPVRSGRGHAPDTTPGEAAH